MKTRQPYAERPRKCVSLRTLAKGLGPTRRAPARIAVTLNGSAQDRPRLPLILGDRHLQFLEPGELRVGPQEVHQPHADLLPVQVARRSRR